MTLEAIKDTMPAHARDIKLNISAVTTDAALTDQQRWGAVLACAITSRVPALITAAEEDAAQRLTPEAANGARIAASIMAMNNIYYRFLHLAGNSDYSSMPARLRMNAMSNPGVDKKDFELWALAVSAMTGCGMCIESHTHHLREAGATPEAILGTVRIAAVINAVATTMVAEGARG